MKTVTTKPAIFGSTPSTRPSIALLKDLLGSAKFYDVVAQLDPDHAAKWHTMVRVQAGFRNAEPNFETDQMRTYSESVRVTLHRIVIELLTHKKPSANVYKAFVELHPTLFKENGACHLPVDEDIRGLLAADPAMILTPGNAELLLKGVFHDKKWKPLVQAASNATREVRTALGLPVTVSGYT